MPDQQPPAAETSIRDRWKREVRTRLSPLRLSSPREEQIVDELSQHLDDQYQELTAGGTPHEDALRITLAGFREGNVLADRMARLRQSSELAPLTPGASSGHILAGVWQDVRYAFRILARQPAFTAAAVLSLALGIGVNAAMFTVIHGVLLAGLPYPRADRLVRLVQAHSGGDVLMREYELVKERGRPFASVTAHRGGGERRIGPPENQNWVSTIMAGGDFLRTLGLQPQIGREFSDDETRAGGPSAIMLSDAVWRGSFNGDPQILGRAIRVNDANATVVGVLPAGFWFPQEVDAVLPLQATGNLSDTGTNTQIIARLPDDIGIARAQADVASMTEQLRQAGGDGLSRNYRGLAVLSYQDWLVGDVRLNLLMLFGATAVLLLIACGNLALLLLTRFAARAGELAVRTALGSSRRRMLAHLLTENLLLTAMGAAAGIAGAYALVQVFVSLVPFTLPAAAPIRVNASVLGFTVVTSIVTAIFVTLVPVLGSPRWDITTSLRAAGRNGGSGQVNARTRNTFIVAEVALSTALLVGAGLFGQTLFRTNQEHLGFVPDRVLTFETPFEPERAKDAANRLAFMRALLERLERMPGVSAAAATNMLPLSGQSNLPTQRDGHPDHSIGGMEVRAVTADYFSVMGIRVVRGRPIGEGDAATNAPVVLVNETVSRTWWPEGTAIGERLTIGRYRGKELLKDVSREVVGVVGDTKARSLQSPPRPTVFVPMSAAFGSGSLAWVVKTDGSRVDEGAIRAAAAAVDRAQRVTRVRTLDQIVAGASAAPRFNASLFAILAGVALVLTILGLYGVLSFVVAQRRQEIGTRIALGASRRHVVHGFLRQGLSLTAIGVTLGLASALFAARGLATLLFGVAPNDPGSFAIVALLVLGVGGAASYIPARRAASIDPVIAMRNE